MDARNNAVAKAKVYADYTRDTLGNSFKELKETPDFKVNLMRADNKAVADEFKILNKLISGKGVKDINMSALGAWRSGLNSYPKGTQQSVLAGKMAGVYDDWLESHLKNAIKEGDEDLADKIFSANSKYAEFKNKFGTDKYKGQKAVIENILKQDEMTPRAMVNTVFGKSMDGKDYTSQYVKRMLDAMPEGAQQERVRDGFRAGLYQKAFEDSYEPVQDLINIGKLKNNLVKMTKNDAFKEFLSTPEHLQATNALIKDLGKWQTATSDRTIVNLSGTAPVMARIADSFGALPVVRSLSLTRGASDIVSDVAKRGARAQSKQDVQKSLAEFYKAISPEIDNQVNFRFYGAAAGGQTAPNTLTGEQ